MVTTRLHNQQNPFTAALWFPAYAGMTVRDAMNDGAGVVLFHPLIPVSGTGTGSLIPLPSRERGILSVGFLCFEGFDCFVAEVVDDFDGDAARRRDGKRPRYVAFDGVPSFSVYLGFQGSLQRFVRVVAGA